MHLISEPPALAAEEGLLQRYWRQAPHSLLLFYPKLRCIRNSRLPSRPEIGESVIPRTSRGVCSGIQAWSSLRTRAWTAGSLITPPPRSTSALPASNWGLTSATIHAPGASRGTIGGRTRRREINETSITAHCIGSGSVVT